MSSDSKEVELNNPINTSLSNSGQDSPGGSQVFQEIASLTDEALIKLEEFVQSIGEGILSKQTKVSELQAEAAVEPYQASEYQFVGPEASRYSFPENDETVESKTYQGFDSTTSHAPVSEPETCQAVKTYHHSGSFNTYEPSSNNFVVALVIFQLGACYVILIPILDLLQSFFRAKFFSLWNAKSPSQKSEKNNLSVLDNEETDLSLNKPFTLRKKNKESSDP